MKTVGGLFLLTLFVAGATGSAATFKTEPPRLTYVVEGRGICLAGQERSRDVRLTRSGRSTQPTWSPDGRRLAFASFGFLFVQDARGHGRQIAGDSTHNDANPAWSPDGRRIAFHAGAHGAFIHTIRPDGSGDRTLTPGQFDVSPAWSPDAAHIAFESQDARPLALYVIESNGSGRRLLVEDGSDPSWSPDGEWIVFVRQVATLESDLFVIGADGTGERRLTAQAGYDNQPSWSPDGHWIAFTRQAPGDANRDIAVIRPDGTGLHVVRDLTVSLSDPTWRPRAVPRRGKGPCLARGQRAR